MTPNKLTKTQRLRKTKGHEEDQDGIKIMFSPGLREQQENTNKSFKK